MHALHRLVASSTVSLARVQPIIAVRPRTVFAVPRPAGVVLAISTRLHSTTNQEARPSMAVRFKEGALHYWQGTKLLAYETRISFRLLGKVLRGEPLLRREYRQLLRTTVVLRFCHLRARKTILDSAEYWCYHSNL